MISLASEFTDGKSRHAAGWLFYDAQCGYCTRFARFVAPSLEKRGFALAPLQDPRVGVLLGFSRSELMRELRFLCGDGTQFGGADAILALARVIGWARPLAWFCGLPGAGNLLRALCRRIAQKRHCPAELCSVRRMAH